MNHPVQADLDDLDANHPELRLRITRTLTDSIHVSDREDARRKVGKRRKPFGARRTIFGTIKKDKKLNRADTTSKQSTKKDAAYEDADASESPSTALGLEEQQAKAEKFAGPESSGEGLGKGKKGKKAAESRRRRNIYVNMPLRPEEIDRNGQPLARWARNKVRTSKYTLWSFVPKNLLEQFRRVANIYFLGLVILQIFSIFGAAAPEVAMLPLVVILLATGIKDAIEDSRRHAIDNGVNNAAITRLTGWRNVNQPADGRSFFERLIGVPNPHVKVSKGVRKLRAKEGSLHTDFLHSTASQSDPNLDRTNSIDEYSLSYSDDFPQGRARSNTNASKSTIAPSYRSTSGQLGVVDYSRQAPGTAQWERTLWKKVEVGDIVLLRENDQVPADIVVLSSSDPDGTCFVETKNLDGETNLKPRKSLRGTMSIQAEEDAEHAEFVIDSEPPHANLYSYNAVLHYTSRSADGAKGAEKIEPITINELLLRGCALRNTAWVIGLVVFTGPDTKIMMNQGETPSKRSKVEKETNFNVISNFVILVAMCLACGIASGIYVNGVGSMDFYEPGTLASNSIIVNSIVVFGASLILFQNIVPISLVISIELVKTVQALFIYNDLDMYYEPLDHPCVPKTWNISDDLGQIEYIFSDKTGTLTQNVMEFKRCSINGQAYGEGITEASLGAAMREGSALNPGANIQQLEAQKEAMVFDLNRQFKNKYLQEDRLTLISSKFAQDLGEKSSEQRAKIIEFFRSLALCHTVLSDRPDSTKPHFVNYKAESPDEAALVAAARDVGFVFLEKTSGEVTIEVMGQVERWKPLRVLEFNSTRKRMSVIVRGPDNRLLLICKGADSIIYQRLKADQDVELKEVTSKDMEEFANGGLRTLCIASRYLTEEEYAEWVRNYDAACAMTTDREEEIEKTCETIEQNLTLLGATALEDKLQAGVPETIEALHQAGIKLWILTGDKLQTAIEIGFSCNLLKSEMEIMIISADTEAGTRSQIEAGLKQVSDSPKDSPAKQDYAVVIDGETLRFALQDSLKPLFLDLTTQCATVVCCRVSPAQKAQTVKLVKDGKKAMTLAIGDGANDVAMIQEAHVGVGIAGLEGAQASMSADYAVGQFRYLTKLLLVHGRWCYKRVAVFHEVFFYKNAIWTFAMFWYQLYCSFDSTYLFDYSYIMLYSTVFTSLPVLVLGALDQDVDAKASLAFPSLYKRGIAGLEYTKSIFWAFILDGVFQSIVCFYIPFWVYGFTTTSNQQGKDTAIAELGTTIAVSAIFAANIYTGLVTQSWTKLATICIIFSALSGFIWTAIYSAFPYLLSGVFQQTLSTPNFWLSFLLIQVVCLSPRFVYDFVQKTYFPRDVDIVRERQAFGLLKASELDSEAQVVQSVRPQSPPPPFNENGQVQPRWTNNDSTYTLHDEVLASQRPLRARTQSENTEVLDIKRPQSQYEQLERPQSQYEQLSRPQSQYEQQEFGYALTRDPSRAESFVSTNSFATAPGSPERL